MVSCFLLRDNILLSHLHEKIYCIHIFMLNLLESGILSSTKVRKTRSIRMEGVKVFATSNDSDRLTSRLKSRFLEFVLPEYTWENFLEITQKLLHNRYGLEEITSAKIALVVWSSMQTRDIRDVLAIAKCTKNLEDVEFHRYDTSKI